MPVKKKEFDLSAFKKKNGLNNDVKDKDLEWIPLSQAFHDVTGLPGLPKGYVILSRGYSNTGKSTSMIEGIVSCQKLGILPVIMDTENSFNWQHARDMGMEFEEIIDEETGEVVNYDGFFIFVNNDDLHNNYGKKRNKDLHEAVIEDVAEFMHDLLDKQANGELDKELCFFWDSIGTLDCEKCVTGKNRNNMWNAAAMEISFKSLVNSRIPGSRKENKPYTNTFFAVQKIWLDNENKVIKHKGGEAMFYAARIIIHFGGIITHGTKKHAATLNKKDYVWGTEVKVEVIKNQITGLTYKGSIISTAHGFITDAMADKYKRANRAFFLQKLGEVDGDITFKEEEVAGGPESD